MCVIVHQPKDAHLTKERAQRLWGVNEDGGGFSFIDNIGNIKTEKHMAFADYWRDFEKARSAFPRRDFLLHMRIATHGTVDITNVHPFQVDEHTVMAHNGIIQGVPDHKDGRSDTRVFIDEVLPQLPHDWLDKPYLVDMVEDWIGWSKLMFLTSDLRLSQSVYILNKHTGVETENMWFSNSHGVYPVAQPKTPQFVYRIGDSYEEVRRAWDDKDTGIYAPSYLKLATKESEVTKRKELMRKRDDELTPAMIYFDNVKDAWVCEGCLAEVEETTGDCACWDTVCVECEHFAAECACRNGYSLNMVSYDQATDHLRRQAWNSLGEGAPYQKETSWSRIEENRHLSDTTRNT